MGKRGPKPGTGGRPKKALSDKLIEGNRGKRPIKVLKSVENAEEHYDTLPEPKEYLSANQKRGELTANKIHDDVWKWLQERKCAEFVSPELVEHYAISAGRMIQCEEAISEFGLTIVSKKKGEVTASPYVAIARDYMKQTNSIWQMIYQIVLENCTTEFKAEKDDPMERLLAFRKSC